MQRRISSGIDVQRSSDNVYRDLGLPDAEKLKIKTGLVIEIRKAMRNLGLTPGLFNALYRPLYERLRAGSRAAAQVALAMLVTPFALAMLSA